MSAQTHSIGLRSGDFAGAGALIFYNNIFILSLKYNFYYANEPGVWHE
jgi:hypothetical protein